MEKCYQFLADQGMNGEIGYYRIIILLYYSMIVILYDLHSCVLLSLTFQQAAPFWGRLNFVVFASFGDCQKKRPPLMAGGDHGSGGARAKSSEANRRSPFEDGRGGKILPPSGRAE